MQMLSTRKLFFLWKVWKKNNTQANTLNERFGMAAFSLFLFAMGSNSISVGLLWSPLQWEETRPAESHRFDALRRSKPVGKPIHSVWIAQKENNSIYDGILQKSNIVEIFGISADTSWFWFSFKRHNSHRKEKKKEGKSYLAEISFISNNLDRDFEQPIFAYCKYYRTNVLSVQQFIYSFQVL